MLCLEYLLGKANSLECFDIHLNINIVHYFIEDNEKINSKFDIDTNNFKSNSPNSNFCTKEKCFDGDSIKYNFLESPIPTLTEESEEDMNQKRSNRRLRPSLYRKSVTNYFSLDINCVKINDFHDFLKEYKAEFSEFTRLGTFLIEIKNETKYYEILIKISNFLGDIKFEYIINDVTKQKLADKIKKEQKVKSLFLAKIAHEFKNPIITISNLCYALTTKVASLPLNNITYHSSDESSDEDKSIQYKRKGSSFGSISSIQETTNFITNTGNYLMSLIEDLNFFSKMEQENKNLSDLNQPAVENYREFELIPTLEFCLTIFRLRQKQDENKKGVRILSDYDKKLPDKIITNQVKFKQILINLLSNAYKFTAFGNIKLCAKLIDNGLKSIIRFEVIDTGSGIPESQIQNLCKPFGLNTKNQSMNENGSGLGLFIVNDLLKQINSALAFKSVEGKGSNFWFDYETTKEMRNSIELSTKTIVHHPVMTESLKNLYIYMNDNNDTEGIENVSEDNSKLIFKFKEALV